jgi:hypothetical protein
MRPNHIAVSKGIPRVHRRTKSQDFGPKPNQTLQNSLLEKPNYGRPSNGLGKLSGRLAEVQADLYRRGHEGENMIAVFQ